MRDLRPDTPDPASSSVQLCVCTTLRTYRYRAGLPGVPSLISRLLFACSTRTDQMLSHCIAIDSACTVLASTQLRNNPHRVCYYTRLISR